MWHRTKDSLPVFWGELCKKKKKKTCNYGEPCSASTFCCQNIYSQFRCVRQPSDSRIAKTLQRCFESMVLFLAKCGKMSNRLKSREADALVFAPLQFNQGPESLSKAVDVARFTCFSFPPASLCYITVRVSSSSCCLQSVTPPFLAASLGRWGVAGNGEMITWHGYGCLCSISLIVMSCQ